MAIERQELQCTNCGKYVRFDMDFGLDGNHEITCPLCQHIHYRVVKNGKITEERWNSSAGSIFTVSNVSASTGSYGVTMCTGSATTSSYYLYDSWMQSS
jgi:hypothetical protein